MRWIKTLLHPNTIGLLIVIAGFVISASRVMMLSMESGEGPLQDDGSVVIRIAHWQLEPGYREALQAIIDDYEALPRVKAAGVKVRQLAVTERVYAQFLNTHIISGTAPDICERGQARMTMGNYTAKYFEPLGDRVQRPNPYNAPEYLPPDLDAALAEALSTGPWRDTFVDGMQGGWDDRLQDYYAAPSAFWGPLRVYLNRGLLAEGMTYLGGALAAEPRPVWLRDALAERYVSDDEAFRDWVVSGSAPDTFGRLLMLSRAVTAMASETGRSKLVPISGSSYSARWMYSYYIAPFTHRYAGRMDVNMDSAISRDEQCAAWSDAVWRMDDRPMRDYLESMEAISRGFPPGFLGLDREQSIRRFLLENAAMLFTGGWDASTVFEGAKKATVPFEVEIVQLPLPAPGERWYDAALIKPSEAAISAGVPYQVYQRSANKEWAIDFLRYMTSYSVNQKFNQLSGWLPCIIGTSPVPRMDPFIPDAVGAIPAYGIDLRHRVNSYVRMGYEGQIELLIGGEATVDEVIERVGNRLSNEHNGIPRLYSESDRLERDITRGMERLMAVQDLRHLILNNNDLAGATGAADAEMKYRLLLFNSLKQLGATRTRSAWSRTHSDEPFPEF
ncbi:type 2 periplasmic-binding domain-containing protein [Mucisphaera calidilacus]|uniref:Extracellular solute-binding protein n=1 Tax=Mucisphaera calidilacus TaxID=2527982 RepID=A0A518BX27_9BACT|nr:hypothetical protein [Mucisphaera calidilacus]QDU71494.1 hypothetical protein Pan265_13440 [Mucisphaera calidilacus]